MTATIAVFRMHTALTAYVCTRCIKPGRIKTAHAVMQVNHNTGGNSKIDND
jgi:hypothetical protein